MVDAAASKYSHVTLDSLSIMLPNVKALSDFSPLFNLNWGGFICVHRYSDSNTDLKSLCPFILMSKQTITSFGRIV